MNINATNPAMMAVLATNDNQQNIAMAVAKKTMSIDKANGEQVLQLVASAATSAEASRLDVFA